MWPSMRIVSTHEQKELVSRFQEVLEMVVRLVIRSGIILQYGMRITGQAQTLLIFEWRNQPPSTPHGTARIGSIFECSCPARLRRNPYPVFMYQSCHTAKSENVAVPRDDFRNGQILYVENPTLQSSSLCSLLIWHSVSFTWLCLMWVMSHDQTFPITCPPSSEFMIQSTFHIYMNELCTPAEQLPKNRVIGVSKYRSLH